MQVVFGQAADLLGDVFRFQFQCLFHGQPLSQTAHGFGADKRIGTAVRLHPDLFKDLVFNGYVNTDTVAALPGHTGFAAGIRHFSDIERVLHVMKKPLTHTFGRSVF